MGFVFPLALLTSLKLVAMNPGGYSFTQAAVVPSDHERADKVQQLWKQQHQFSLSEAPPGFFRGQGYLRGPGFLSNLDDDGNYFLGETKRRYECKDYNFQTRLTRFPLRTRT